LIIKKLKEGNVIEFEMVKLKLCAIELLDVPAAKMLERLYVL